MKTQGELKKISIGSKRGRTQNKNKEMAEKELKARSFRSQGSNVRFL